MRFKKGAEVEVMDKGKGPFGSWRRAVIVKGNGHTYIISYDIFYHDMISVTDKVPRKSIRPLPPPMEIKSCALGDTVEVYENKSWKIGEILGFLGRSIIIARLLGSSKEIQVHFSHTRLPQTWNGNCWIAFQRDSRKHKNAAINGCSKGGSASSQILKSCVDVRTCGQDDLFAAHDGCADTLGRMKKRLCACINPVITGSCKKSRANNEKERNYTPFVPHLPSQLLGKVDAVVSPREHNGGKYMHAPLKYRAAGFCQKDMKSKRPFIDARHNFVESIDISDDESTSSIGSCSFNNGSYRSIHHKDTQRKESHGHIDDAESFSGPKEKLLIRKKEILPENRNLELDEYNSTMMSLYEYGSLSWEQESLLTNLRLALKISNDEHLSVLKQMFSSRR